MNNTKQKSTEKKFLFSTIISLLVIFFQLSFSYAQTVDANLGIIPVPFAVKVNSGEFIFSQQTLIQADDPKNKAVVFLRDYLLHSRNFGNKISINGSAKPKKGKTLLVLTAKGSENLPAEGYTLEITPGRIKITGKDAGLFYGIQSFIQLFPIEKSASFKLPCAVIEDQPRFGYRGMMLDVSRHFFSVAEVKKFLDRMATYKLNRFQWHLTDNQGWRIEIKKYPKLTSVGAYRDLTLFGNNRDWLDSVFYGGFYTQEEIKEVVKYAAERYITVIPEIEMPGHSEAALRAYPELKCELPKNSKQKHQYDIIYCPTEQTVTFLQDVLSEVMTLFPGQYIHIGGDEAYKLPWRESAFCQKLIRDLNLKDENGLQSYFIQRMEKFINSKGKSIIGWDEILEGGLAPNATVMSWRGEAGGISAAKQKHNVIMSPSSAGMYFDYYQSTSNMEPVNYAGYAPLWKTYSYNPVPDSLTKEEQAYIVGVQANIWTEAIATPAKLEYMYLPRMLASSEVAWSSRLNKNYKNFSEARLPGHLAKFDASGYNYRVPEAFNALDTTMIGSKFTIKLRPPMSGSKIYYTFNGRTPGDTDLEYTGPLTFFIPENERRELQTLVITPFGRRSVATRTVMYNRSLLPAISYSGNSQGLKYKLIIGKFTTAEQIEYASVIDSGITQTFSVNEFKKNNPALGLIYEGFVSVDKDGAYYFSLSSDEGSQLFIDNEKVADNDKPYVRFEKGGAIPLTKGFHKIKVKYFDSGGAGALKVYMTAPGSVKKELTAEVLFN
jgi:hexosaminidase